MSRGLLFYGHFDIQPAVPSQWKTKPYKPEIKNGRMYGRGATGNKGPNIAFISAVEAIMKLDGKKLPVNVKCTVSGAKPGRQSRRPNSAG